MTLEEINEKIITPGLKFLPDKMDSVAARAQLLTIGLQESRFKHRSQIGGPAKGYWQFERYGGVYGVMTHHTTKDYIREILKELNYDYSQVSLAYAAIEHNDLLAVCFARLLMWTYPGPLPKEGDYENSWHQYLETWRPGDAKPETWDSFYYHSWKLVK